MFKSVKNFIISCIVIYVILFGCLYWLLAFPGSDMVGDTFTYFGFVILSSVILYLSKK